MSPRIKIKTLRTKCQAQYVEPHENQPLRSIRNRRFLPTLSTHNIPTDNIPNTCNGSLSNSAVTGFQSNSTRLSPRQLLNLGSFDVRPLMQTGEQVGSVKHEFRIRVV